MTFNLKVKLYASMTVALCMLLMMIGVNVYSNRASTAALGSVFENNVQPLMAIQEIEGSLREIRFRIAGVLLDQFPAQGSRNNLKELRAAIDKQWALFLVANRPETKDEEALVDKLKTNLILLPPIFDKIDAAYGKADKKSLEVVLDDDWPSITAKISKPLGQLIPLKNKSMSATYGASIKLGEHLSLTALIIFVSSAVILLVFTYFIVSSITRPLEEVRRVLACVAQGDLTARPQGSGQDEIGVMASSLNTALDAMNATLHGVQKASERLSRAAATLSQDASDAREQTSHQVDSVMNVSAAMEELTVSVAEIAHQARDIADASVETRDVARGSNDAAMASKESSLRALEAVSVTTVAMQELSASIDRIGDVAHVIKEIADQTNLLALNASIEAARAGESGRGFAVVADEVGKLAARTVISTSKIDEMIKSVQEKATIAADMMARVNTDVKNGADQTENLAAAFAKIVSTSNRLTDLAGDIAHGTNEQSQVAQQTSQSMEIIAQAVEQTGGSVARVAFTAGETATTAENMKALVSRFQIA
jgi:methyl-accepting chemotaxis protein